MAGEEALDLLAFTAPKLTVPAKGAWAGPGRMGEHV